MQPKTKHLSVKFLRKFHQKSELLDKKTRRKKFVKKQFEYNSFHIFGGKRSSITMYVNYRKFISMNENTQNRKNKKKIQRNLKCLRLQTFILAFNFCSMKFYLFSGELGLCLLVVVLFDAVEAFEIKKVSDQNSFDDHQR